MAKPVVVDSDAIFALYNPNDPLNERATRTFRQLIDQDRPLLYPSSVVFEVVSLFQRVLPTPNVTRRLVEMIKDGKLPIYVVDVEILQEAAAIFDPGGGKRNTLIDCSVVAVARRVSAEAVFAYDRFYARQGLRLAEELV